VTGKKIQQVLQTLKLEPFPRTFPQAKLQISSQIGTISPHISASKIADLVFWLVRKKQGMKVHDLLCQYHD